MNGLEKVQRPSRPVVVGRGEKDTTHQRKEKHSPSSETVQPLRPRQTQGRERRLSFKKLGVRDHTARSLQVEPSFAGHRRLCLGVDFWKSNEGAKVV